MNKGSIPKYKPLPKSSFLNNCTQLPNIGLVAGISAFQLVTCRKKNAVALFRKISGASQINLFYDGFFLIPNYQVVSNPGYKQGPWSCKM